jgi:hypothetical protein
VISVDSVNDPAARIRRALDAAPDGMTRTELWQMFSRHLDVGVLDRLMAYVLTDPRYGTKKVATAGRPQQRYFRRDSTTPERTAPMTTSRPTPPASRHTEPHHHREPEWTTVAVTPLPPGWRTVYRAGLNGRRIVCQCPAILLQEHRCDHEVWTRPQPDGPSHVSSATYPCVAPYETRAVYADTAADGDYLLPASEADNFVGVLAPGEDPDRLLPADGTP